jgi:hypothetical protein
MCTAVQQLSLFVTSLVLAVSVTSFVPSYACIDGHMALKQWADPGTALKSTAQARHTPVHIVLVSCLGHQIGP